MTTGTCPICYGAVPDAVPEGHTALCAEVLRRMYEATLADIQQHVLALGHAIDALPTGEEQTKLSLQASALQQKLQALLPTSRDAYWAVFDRDGRLVKEAPSEGAAVKLAATLNREPLKPEDTPYQARTV